MRLVVLLGSGASIPAGMPSTPAITDRVLSGRNVVRRGEDFHLVDHVPHHHDPSTPTVAEVVEFIRELKHLCDEYFASQDKDRIANYEDIAYVARQIDDGLTSEYENPALLPLNQRLGGQIGRAPDELQQLASDAADYIQDVVRDLLGGPVGDAAHLDAVVEAFRDPLVEQLDLATLNHDLVAEFALRQARIAFSDGFEDQYGTLRIWTDTYNEAPRRRLFKLHGSIDWYRYYLERDGRAGQETARSTGERDAFHPRGPNGEDLGFPAGGRPQILTGTFNKILSYPTGIYADQHYRFHESLRHADRLLVAGYGFRDKAINARLVAWAATGGQRRLVIVHREPTQLGAAARGAIRDKWREWQQRGLLAFLPEHLSAGTQWDDLRAVLE